MSRLTIDIIALGSTVLNRFLVSFLRPAVRSRAVSVIKSVRAEEAPTPGEVRKFVVPTLNFGAADYPDLVPWTSKKKVSVSEPPLTSHLTVAQLEELAATGSSELVLTAIPCHSQAVERHVRMVSNASKRVVGEQKRHENILGTLESRSQMPSFRTKRDFK